MRQPTVLCFRRRNGGSPSLRKRRPRSHRQPRKALRQADSDVLPHELKLKIVALALENSCVIKVAKIVMNSSEWRAAFDEAVQGLARCCLDPPPAGQPGSVAATADALDWLAPRVR